MTAKKTLADTAKISKSLADAARSSVMADTAMGCRNFDSVRAGVKRLPACASLQQLPHACMHAHTHRRQSHARIKRVKSGISPAVFGLKPNNI